jgi:hypothetical protein
MTDAQRTEMFNALQPYIGARMTEAIEAAAGVGCVM